jgi:hypothetical protein
MYQSEKALIWGCSSVKVDKITIEDKTINDAQKSASFIVEATEGRRKVGTSDICRVGARDPTV